MIILQLSDFSVSGKYNIPDAGGAYTSDALQDAIDKYEKPAIYKLLGVTLGNLFITWATTPTPPVNADYTKIKDPFAVDDNTFCRGIINSLGMKEYLLAAVFYEYVHDDIVTAQAGAVKVVAETATVLSPAATQRFAENKFNDILQTVEAIQWYCVNNTTAFPDFNGQRIDVKYSSLL